MGVNIIIRGVISLFLTGLVFLVMMPHIYEFSHSEDYWKDVHDQRALSIRNTVWIMFQASGIIILGAIIFWMYNASTRKTASQAYE